jgi:hypothetical protein
MPGFTVSNQCLHMVTNVSVRWSGKISVPSAKGVSRIVSWIFFLISVKIVIGLVWVTCSCLHQLQANRMLWLAQLMPWQGGGYAVPTSLKLEDYSWEIVSPLSDIYQTGWYENIQWIFHFSLVAWVFSMPVSFPRSPSPPLLSLN